MYYRYAPTPKTELQGNQLLKQLNEPNLSQIPLLCMPVLSIVTSVPKWRPPIRFVYHQGIFEYFTGIVSCSGRCLEAPRQLTG